MSILRATERNKKEIPAVGFIHLFWSGGTLLCLECTWPAVSLGKYQKKAVSRLLGCCNLAFKKN